MKTNETVCTHINHFPPQGRPPVGLNVHVCPACGATFRVFQYPMDLAAEDLEGRRADEKVLCSTA